ncbi:MAG TPA: hypothetical protein VFG20_23295 [Planctomycetaceae bacterium]|jgi:hypothetical protein|nr:hypothetical protein [Planctomycetaceae bacterium]
MDFNERLQRAVERGQSRRDAELRAQSQALLTEEQFRALHSQARLELSDHLEAALQQLADTFPGFTYQTVATPEGFGAKISRNDLRSRPGKPIGQEYSHLELIIRSYSSGHLLEIGCRGAIANKEVLQRSHFQMLNRLDIDTFRETIDHWILEYAEKFAAA